MSEVQKKRVIVSSTLARIVAFFLLAISFLVGVSSSFFTMELWEMEAYTSGIEQMIKDEMRSRVVWDDLGYIKILYQRGDMEGIESYLSRRNIAVEIYASNVEEDDKTNLIWGNYDGFETGYSFNCFTDMFLSDKVQELTALQDEAVYLQKGNVYSQEQEVGGEQQEVLFRIYVKDGFPYEDEYQAIYEWGMFVKNWLYVIPVMAVLGVFLFLVNFVFLMCCAGHHRGQEGTSGGVLYYFPFDVVTVLFGSVFFPCLIIGMNMVREGGASASLAALAVMTFTMIWFTIYCMEFATELKLGTLFRHTLIFVVLRKCGRAVRKLCHGMITLIRGLPLVAGALLAYVGFSVVQFMVLAFFCELWFIEFDVLLLCICEKIILLPVFLSIALVCKKLQQGSEALAEGRFSYKVNTSKMFWDFKKHGENLNRIGEGIAAAVDERMKSEHLKTELITNVSHDLKTPLTSIINYANLIGTVTANGSGDELQREQLTEYSEVLVRQSKRLKKLLEDLVEASKATTGNLEVKLEQCEISVILSQAIGEYVQRFAEKELTLLVKQPEEAVYIQADGRHLWRVFDNLLNNICKYAQEGTRVYLTVESKDGRVEIVFRNMSKYQLDVSAQELQERFVRGDKSRHMEGNGLGLSIAGSLVELQNGTMEIVTDGDLFKVILRFSQNLS